MPAPGAGVIIDVMTDSPGLPVMEVTLVKAAGPDDRDRAWRSTDVAERFASGLGAHLKPGGCALVLLSSFGDAPVFLEEFRKRDLAVQVLAQPRFVNETLAIFRLEPSAAGMPS